MKRITMNQAKLIEAQGGAERIRVARIQPLLWLAWLLERLGDLFMFLATAVAFLGEWGFYKPCLWLLKTGHQLYLLEPGDGEQ